MSNTQYFQLTLNFISYRLLMSDEPSSKSQKYQLPEELQHAKPSWVKQQHRQHLNQSEQSLLRLIKLAIQPQIKQLKQISADLLRLQCNYQQIKSGQNQVIEQISNIKQNCSNIAQSFNRLLNQTQGSTRASDASRINLTPNRKIKILKKQNQLLQNQYQSLQRQSTPEFKQSDQLENLEDLQLQKQQISRAKFMQTKNPNKQVKVKNQKVKHQIDPQYQQIVKSSLILASSVKSNTLTKNLAQALKQRDRDIYKKYKMVKLYQFPMQLGINYSHKFHQYIDNKPNILLLIELKNLRTILAAFTSIPFIKRNIPQPNQQAFIANLSHNRFYKPKNYCKTICFDQNFLLFGNSEIRIKIKQEKFYTNFGIAKGFFQNGKDGLAQFVEQDIQQLTEVNRVNRFDQKIEQDKYDKNSRREFQIVRYQIFQLVQRN